MNPTMNKQLIVFDFDFTLVKTIEHVWVISPRGNLLDNGQTYRRVHPTQLQQSGIADDESIDENTSFKEFYSLNTEKIKIIQPIFLYLKYFTSIQEVYILTARPQSIQQKVFDFLKKNDVDVTKIHFLGLANSSFHEKIKWLTEITNNDFYEKVIIFEDNKKLVNYLLEHGCINNVAYAIYYINTYHDKITVTYYESKTKS